MNADVLSTKVTEGIAVITLGSAKRMYFDAEMGDALTENLQEFAGDPNIRVVIVTGGTPGYFNRHFSIPALIEFAEAVRASGRQWPDNAAYHGGFFDKAMALCETMPKPVIAAISGTALAGAFRRKEGSCSRNRQWQGHRSCDGDRKTVLLAYTGIARLYQASRPQCDRHASR